MTVSNRFVFIGALRHRDNATDYSRVLQLLESSLSSVLQQTSPGFQIVIGCNEIPALAVSDPRIHFVLVPRAEDLKQKKRVPHLKLQSRRKDKATKYLEALLYAKRFNPQYAMMLDLDDYIHKDLVRFIFEQDDSDVGWFIDKGYLWHQRSRVCQRIDSDFHQKCGTSVILNYESLFDEHQGDILLEIISHPHMQPPEDTIRRLVDGKHLVIDRSRTSLRGLEIGQKAYRNLDENFLLYVLSGHKRSAKYFGLRPLPIYGVVYNKETGENCGGESTVDQSYSAMIDWSDFLPERES